MDDNEILEVAKQMTLIESSFIEKLTHVDLLQWENFILRVGEGEGEGNTPPKFVDFFFFFFFFFFLSLFSLFFLLSSFLSFLPFLKLNSLKKL